MAATFRGKVSEFWSSFLEHMQALQGTTAPGTTSKYQQVVEGESSSYSRPLPFILVQLISAEVSGRADNAKIWSVKVRVRVASTIENQDGATDNILAHTANIENHIEAFPNPSGCAGPVNESWSYTFPISPDGGGKVEANTLRTYSVTVAPKAN